MAQNLIEEYDEFDKVPCPMMDEATLDAVAKNKAQNAKITETKKVIKRAEQTINTKLARLGFSTKVKLNETFSCGAEKLISTQTNLKGSSGQSNIMNIKLNINANKLKFPAFEFSSMVSAAVYRTVMANMSSENIKKMQENIEAESTLQNGEPELKNAVRHDNELASLEVARWFLTEYVKDFLKQSFPDEFNHDTISLEITTKLLCDDLLSRMSPSEIQNLPRDLFSFKNFDDKISKASKRFVSSENLYQMRTQKLRDKATQFAADPTADYSNAEAISNEQQFEALSETFAGKTDKVKDVLASGFSNDNMELRAFCQQYADSFMASNNLESIQINFVNKGGCEYNDKGTTHEININLSSEIFRGGSVCELLMTLSHELTHAVDSSINKINGRVNENGGGLLNTMSEDLSACDEPSAMPLLKKVQSFCYQLNPNERHARIGELSAVRFMKELYAGDAEMESQMEESMESYKSYQQTTMNCAGILPEKLEQFENELSGLNISEKSKAYQMIKKRIEYLRGLSQTMDCSAEQRSIEDMLKIAHGTSARETAQNVAAQEMQ